jgi:outer membrane protein TolC
MATLSEPEVLVKADRTPLWHRAGGALRALAMALAALAALAPGVRAADPSLNALVAEGLQHNRALAGEKQQVVKARAQASEALGLFLPTVSVYARDSDRQGNVVDFGKLVNPAFAALNGILQKDAFPTDVTLKTPSKQETYLRVTQPIFDARLWGNLRARSNLRDLQAAVYTTAERRLAADVRSSYLDYAKATRLHELYDSTLVLVNQNVRANESLLRNGQTTPDAVLRARADRSELEQKSLDAARMADAARQSLNRVLGRTIDAPLPLLAEEALGLDIALPLDSALAASRAHRAELAQVRAGERAAKGALTVADAGYLPSVVAAYDWGVQGEKYRFESGQDYRVASLILQWTLFNGGQREAQRRQALADLERARLQQADVEQLVELDVRTSWQAAQVSRQALQPAQDRLAAAARTFDLVAKRFTNGSASLLEYLDARTTYTSAGLNAILTQYDHLQRCAELVRATALEPGARAQEGETR